ncbi:hypothetical protein DITRI_Ditri14bG0127700 [Diplodiscus trichospermus]
MDVDSPSRWKGSPESISSSLVYQSQFSTGSSTVLKVFGEGSLFSSLLFGKFFDPSDAFPLWDFESYSLLSNLRNSGKSKVDWFQTEQAPVLKAELPGVLGQTNMQIHVKKGKILKISGQLKQQRESKIKDWRSCDWWEYGYVRRLELTEDADWRRTEAYLSNNQVLEIRIPRNPSHTDTPEDVVGKSSE